MQLDCKIFIRRIAFASSRRGLVSLIFSVSLISNKYIGSFNGRAAEDQSS